MMNSVMRTFVSKTPWGHEMKLLDDAGKHLAHAVVPHHARHGLLALLLSSFASSVSVSGQLQPALHVPLDLLVHRIFAERVLPDGVCRGGGEQRSASSTKLRAWRADAAGGVLTEDDFLDGQALDLLLVVSSPPVHVFGQRVGKKFGHDPPDAFFGRHATRQAQV